MQVSSKLYSFISWLPVIKITGEILANLCKKSLAMTLQSGFRLILVWRRSPVMTIKNLMPLFFRVVNV